MSDSRSVSWAFALASLGLAIATLIAKLYLELYAYNNLLRRQFNQLPELSLLQLWAVTISVAILFHRLPEREPDKSTEQVFKDAVHRALQVFVLWMFAWSVVEYLY